MNRDVDEITDMKYASYLFWMNFYKLEQEDAYRNRKQ